MSGDQNRASTIENWYADQFEQWHPKNDTSKADPDSIPLIGTGGDAVWLNGELSETIQGPNGRLIEVKGYWSNIYVREGDTWKIRLDTYNVTPAPAQLGREVMRVFAIGLRAGSEAWLLAMHLTRMHNRAFAVSFVPVNCAAG